MPENRSVVRQRLHSVRSGIFGKPHLGHLIHCEVSIGGDVKELGIDPLHYCGTNRSDVEGTSSMSLCSGAGRSVG